MTAPGELACADVDDLAAAYVLGALAPVEEVAVRHHLASCQQPHPELAQLGGVVPYLAAAAEPIEPSRALRARILAAVSPDAVAPSRPVTTPSQRSALRLPTHGRPWFRLGLAAAAVAILALVGSTGYLALRLSQAEDYASAVARAATLASEAGSRAIKLAPAAGSALGAGAAGIAVVSADRTGIVTIDGLAPTSGAEVYEAWLIAGAAQPIPAGSFRVAADGRGWLESVPIVRSTGPLTIAVTREAGPGAVVPTLPILLSGAAGT